MALLLRLFQSYVVVSLAALFVGLAFSSLGKLLAPLTTFFLQIIFFLSSLKIDGKEFARELRSAPSILIATLYTLIAFPVVAYGIARFFNLESSIALLLLAAMPAGMTSPLLSEIIGGSVSFSMVLTAATSLLAPLTIPFVISFLAGASVAVPIVSIFQTLLLVIVIPFIAAQVARRFFLERIEKFFPETKPISLILLGLLIVAVVSQQAEALLANPFAYGKELGILTLFFALLHAIGYWGVPWLTRAQRLSSAICLTYMNFTLAIYLAGKFFPAPNILIPVILSVFPWTLGMIPFTLFVNKKVVRQ